MKRVNIFYWIFNGLLIALMLSSAIPSLLMTQQSIDFMDTHLGYPLYLIPFLAVAKILGIIALLVPGFRFLKEWAYAGFAFDLIGAIYSLIAVGDPLSGWFPLIIGIGILAGSYIFYHKRIAARAANGK